MKDGHGKILTLISLTNVMYDVEYYMEIEGGVCEREREGERDWKAI